MSYDTWLCAPYEEAAEEAEAFIAFCESRDLDPDDPKSETAYEDAIADAAEARAEALAEARAERYEDFDRY